MKNDSKTRGFSLLEIMITVAIIAVMAVSVVVSFASFEQTVRLKETAGTITDIIKNLELNMIRKDYTKQTVHFENDFLVAEAESANQTLTLTYVGEGPGCAGKKIKADNTGSVTPIYLARRDSDGNNLDIISVYGGTVETPCVDFADSEETEWNFQLFKGSEVSQTIRFIHFNLRRGDDPTTHAILEDNAYTLELTAPYATKKFYENGEPTTDEVALKLSLQGDGETIVLQEAL